MDHDAFHEHATLVLMWATIFAVAVQLVTAVAWSVFRGRMHTLYSWLFGIDPKTVDILAYAYMGVLKLGVILFFLVPWLAMLVTG